MLEINFFQKLNKVWKSLKPNESSLLHMVKCDRVHTNHDGKPILYVMREKTNC
jgi:hypothetical protein